MTSLVELGSMRSHGVDSYSPPPSDPSRSPLSVLPDGPNPGRICSMLFSVAQKSFSISLGSRHVLALLKVLRAGAFAPRKSLNRESRRAVASQTSASEILWQSWANRRLTTCFHVQKLRANFSCSSSLAILAVACDAMNLQS